jgi:HD superfamily phosphohydrolase YqeK
MNKIKKKADELVVAHEGNLKSALITVNYVIHATHGEAKLKSWYGVKDELKGRL